LTAVATPITPTAGVAWSPFSRADAVWVADGRNSGTGVGEFDGVVRPQLSAFAGVWLDHRFGISGSLGVARLQQTVWADEVFVQRHWAVVRPSFDFRLALLKRDRDVPIPWLLLGLHGDIPSAKETSNGFSDEEAELADENARISRAQLGGVGARLGVGADIGFGPHIRVGFNWFGEWHRTVFRSAETQTVSSWIGSQASLSLAFEWPSGGPE